MSSEIFRRETEGVVTGETAAALYTLCRPPSSTACLPGDGRQRPLKEAQGQQCHSVTPDEIASDVRLSGKRLGVDFMVVAHKAIGSYDGAAEMAMEPEIASSTMKESRGWHWPGGNNKPGALAIDYRKRVLTCVGLMMHGPVISKDYEIVPMNDLPAAKSWVETIGFDPIGDFGGLVVEDCFKLTVWARTNEALPSIPLPSDPDDPSRKLPHCAHINFKVLPVQMVPSANLLLWLYYRCVPAITIGASLDPQKIAIIDEDETVTTSYVTVDPITLLSETNWTDNGPAIVAAIRDKTKVPTIDAYYLDSIFGKGVNG
ncbi:hypothetical protein THAOC_06315, partial [Thalassiosira oceanica]